MESWAEIQEKFFDLVASASGLATGTARSRENRIQEKRREGTKRVVVKLKVRQRKASVQFNLWGLNKIVAEGC